MMNVNSVEGFPIKSEVILTETFSFGAEYGGYGSEELKTEPVDCKESFKCKEENVHVEHTDKNAATMILHSSSECNFTTTKKDLDITKNVQSFCTDCICTAQSECFKKEHLKSHNGVDACNFKTTQIFSSTPLLKTPTVIKNDLRKHVKSNKGAKYTCERCNYKTCLKSFFTAHIKIHTVSKHKCKQCDYKTVWESDLKKHVKLHTSNIYICEKCDFKTVWKFSLKEHFKIHTGDIYMCEKCDYKTMWRNNLKEHAKIHAGDIEM